jgi:hypothetical protein
MVNLASPNKHVPKIKWWIQVLKEWSWVESLPGGPMVNLASPNEHVPKIERRIWVVKEWSRAAHHSLPF